MTEKKPDYESMTLEQLQELKAEWLQLAEDHDWFNRLKNIALVLGTDIHEEFHYPYNSGRYIYKRYQMGNIELMYSCTHEKVDPKTGETINNETVTARVDTKFPSANNIVCRLHNKDFVYKDDSIFIPGRWLKKIDAHEDIVEDRTNTNILAIDFMQRRILIEQLLLEKDI